MIIDTSAIVAIALKEPGFEELLRKVIEAPSLAVGVPTLTEAAIPFGDAHFSMAVDAWLRYGKGRHPAGLNFGDCLSYATAKLAGEPLLCTGDDFPQTDVELA
jgi:ribonuclease VapC